MIVRSFESAANGMLALMDMNDNTANNLANVNTIGYKKGSLRFKDVMQSAVYSQEGSIIRNMNENNYLGSLSVGSTLMIFLRERLPKHPIRMMLQLKAMGFSKYRILMEIFHTPETVLL